LMVGRGTNDLAGRLDLSLLGHHTREEHLLRAMIHADTLLGRQSLNSHAAAKMARTFSSGVP
jgi:hypothetical protein